MYRLNRKGQATIVAIGGPGAPVFLFIHKKIRSRPIFRRCPFRHRERFHALSPADGMDPVEIGLRDRPPKKSGIHLTQWAALRIASRKNTPWRVGVNSQSWISWGGHPGSKHQTVQEMPFWSM